MHLFHKWEKVLKKKVIVSGHVLSHAREWAGIGIIEKCTKCGLERGTIKLLSGEAREVDPDFIREALGEGEKWV